MKTVELIHAIKEQILPHYHDDHISDQYAWWMLQAITGQSRAQLLAAPKIDLTHAQQAQLTDWIAKQTVEHMPLQYLLGSVPFNSVDILVRPPTLIARPETEEWTAELIEQIQKIKPQPLSIADVCTGSGCIALALADEFPQADVIGIDIADSALNLARENAAHNGITNASWLKSDLFEQITDGHKFDLIVSNPPYISAQEWATLENSVKKWEDRGALVAADNGLAIIKKIIEKAPHYLKDNKDIRSTGIPQLTIEIGYQQGPAVAQLMKDAGYQYVQIKKDWQQNDRVVQGSKPHVVD